MLVALQPVLFYTDFGHKGSFLAEMRLAVRQANPNIPVIDLMSDAARFRPDLAAYHLAALCFQLPKRSITVAVVDPGVGSSRQGIVVWVNQRWFVGPDNGMFDVLLRQHQDGAKVWELPQSLTASATFHGRDVFAPLAAKISIQGNSPSGLNERIHSHETDRLIQPDIDQVIYIDDFGNVALGRRARTVGQLRNLVYDANSYQQVRTFSDLPAGRFGWLENSLGLVELVGNQINAAQSLRLTLGTQLEWR